MRLLKSRQVRIGGIMLCILLLWFFMQKVRYRYYDHLLPAVVLIAEDLTMIVDFNGNVRIDSCEMILLQGVKGRIEEAKRDNKKIYVDVGHIHLKDWFKFQDVQALLDYCKRTHTHGLHVEGHFKDIPEPFYCMGGCGAYLEIDGDLNFRALWVYRPGIANVLHIIWPSRRFDEDYRSTTSTRFIDKSFGWRRFPSALVAHNLRGVPQKQQETEDKWAKLEEILTSVEGSWEKHPLVKQKLMPLVLTTRNARSDRALYELAEAIRKEEHRDFWYAKQVTMKVYQKIACEPDESVTAAMHEECLFLAGYYYARQGSPVEAVETFSKLRDTYPESKYLTSSILYQADAYAGMGRHAWFVSSDAVEMYFHQAQDLFDLLIRRAEEGNDTNLLGDLLDCGGGGTSLVDDMIGQSAGKWASKLSQELSQDKDRLKKCAHQLFNN